MPIVVDHVGGGVVTIVVGRVVVMIEQLGTSPEVLLN
jgi:hypothetical protein